MLLLIGLVALDTDNADISRDVHVIDISYPLQIACQIYAIESSLFY